MNNSIRPPGWNGRFGEASTLLAEGVLWGAFTKARPDPRLIRNSLTLGDLTLLYSVDKKDIPVGYQDLDFRSRSRPIELIAKAKIKLSKKHGQVFADEEIVRIYRNLAKRNDAYRLPLALALSDLGVTRADLKEWNKSLDATNEALILIEKIAQEKPLAKGELAAILNNLGVILKEKGDFRKSIAYIERSRFLYASLIKSNPAFSDSLGIVDLNFTQHLVSALSAMDAFEQAPRVGRPPSAFSFATPSSLPATQGQRWANQQECDRPTHAWPAQLH
ncbi:MAG: tetratricopeptide repeat protein [Cyanobium sp.]